MTSASTTPREKTTTIRGLVGRIMVLSLTLVAAIYLLTWLIVGWLGCLGAGCCWDCGGCVGWGAH